MTILYPFKFNIIFKEKIWGGRKVRSYLGKDFASLPNCGEAWVLSGMRPDLSVVENGALAGMTLPSLLQIYGAELLGQAHYLRFGNEFPLLVKFIDAADDLSIQAHPNDSLARERHQSCGKTEMWYVVQADAGASLIAGFNQQVNEQAYLDKLKSGRLPDILNRESVAEGDVFFLPAGRVHSIGKGILVAEIQQASDVTYRIHDFDRTGADGARRALHTREALAALDYGHYPDYKSRYARTADAAVRVAQCDYFTTNVLECRHSVTRDYGFDSFVIHVCVKGAYRLRCGGATLLVRMGDCILIPAAVKHATLETQAGFTLLECFIAIGPRAP
jgi:mannose-6-phosphate isomerase